MKGRTARKRTRNRGWGRPTRPRPYDFAGNPRDAILKEMAEDGRWSVTAMAYATGYTYYQVRGRLARLGAKLRELRNGETPATHAALVSLQKKAERLTIRRAS